MSKKDKKWYQCYQCKTPIIGKHNIAGWYWMRWDAHPEWPRELVPICDECAKGATLDKVNELYDRRNKEEPNV